MQKRFRHILTLLLVAILTATLLLAIPACSGGGATPTQTGDDGEIEMSATTKSGKVTVTVRLKKNCGISVMDLTLNYDTKKLTLTGLTEGSALKSLNLMTTNTSTEKGYSVTPFKFSYLNANKNDTSTGVMFTLTFSVKKGASGDTTVGLKYADGAIKSLTGSGLIARAFTIVPVTVSL